MRFPYIDWLRFQTRISSLRKIPSSQQALISLFSELTHHPHLPLGWLLIIYDLWQRLPTGSLVTTVTDVAGNFAWDFLSIPSHFKLKKSFFAFFFFLPHSMSSVLFLSSSNLHILCLGFFFSFSMSLRIVLFF